ncbi:type 1 glutamine amidotransferase domain-containing protein [Amycolatopsis sp. K13G38]|uniref:Type 1 glutamine amidotransferase domain-containing protein n=1 Tax=Amycolatopsis acididurans TaxID=2724524 RepID=A0ABX1JD73_9PSEU|nr:type 1 glutamine amidotransferase domain-containing protein [Amycolatopsis acididurans]NKQ57693.1 type 1 glutamine amidotransferase domain-containing protein [Amycolatopsis acididurans]
MTRALIAVTGVDYWTLADGTRRPSGYWPEELSTPCQVFTDAGFDITVATPGGVEPTADPAGFNPEYHGGSAGEAQRMKEHLESIPALRAPKILEEVDVADYDFVFVPGGWGPMEDLAVSESFGRLVRRFTDAGKPVAAVCHGPAALLPARDDEGEWLFAGRQVTGFSNVEEYAVGFAPHAKWLLEDRLKEEGGLYGAAPEGWAEFVVADGNLYTGQNPASAARLAERLVLDLTAAHLGRPEAYLTRPVS